MLYTVWSHGRRLGQSELAYRRVFRRHRMGDFYPTDIGLKLMPIATGVSPTGIDLARMLHRSLPSVDTGETSVASAEETMRHSSEYADFVAAYNHREALALELRGPDGSVIPTEWIDIRDTEFLLSLAGDDDIDLDGDTQSWEDLEEAARDADSDFSAAETAFGPTDFGGLEDAESDFGNGNEWHGQDPFPRYQLQVMLHDDAAVP